MSKTNMGHLSETEHVAWKTLEKKLHHANMPASMLNHINQRQYEEKKKKKKNTL